ncbi:hypothetical protein EYZ11_012085 [Aspergillus tanneri]|uniref:Uncharacterized protein n=1 Tax=Aspergillus tanneri TaxID=1220188 RepID=A0A4S3J393_9EURO|nr:hypothetical protein EYZ11_012085 [Aspergillus tanneri]
MNGGQPRIIPLVLYMDTYHIDPPLCSTVLSRIYGTTDPPSISPIKQTPRDPELAIRTSATGYEYGVHRLRIDLTLAFQVDD